MAIHETSSNPVQPPQIEGLSTTHDDIVEPHKTFELHVLTDSAELLEARRLRATVYIDEREFLGGADRDSDGGEHDADDDRSIHLGVFANNTEERHLAGTARLIIKSDETADQLLPIEKYYNIEAPVGSVEASRLVVEQGKRAKDSELLVSIALMRAMVHQAMDMGAPYVYAVVEDGLFKHFQKIGLPAEQVGSAEYIEKYQTTNVPIRFKTDSVIESVWSKDTTFTDREGSGKLTTRPMRLGQFFSSAADTLGSGAFDFDDMFPSKNLFSRNLGFLSSEEQEKLAGSTVVIAGAGGDGGLLAEQMVRSGVGKIRLADPEDFGPENINRQAHSGMDVVGQNKAVTVAKALLRINPWLDVEVFPEGVNPENIEDFTREADLVIDETEFTMPELGVMINREARRIGAPVLMAMNIGWGAQVTSFVEGSGKSFEKWLGIPEDMPLDEVVGAEVGIDKWLAHLPSYVDLNVFKKVAEGEMSAPSLAGGVAVAAGVGNEQAMRHLLGTQNRRAKPVIAPRAIYIDPVDGMRVVRNTQFSFYKSLARVVALNKLKRVPKVG